MCVKNKAERDALAEKVVYTGPIDAYFDYQLGFLEYRSVRFENEVLDQQNFQGNAAVNYTDRETPWTRIIEHKWFEFGEDEYGNDEKNAKLYDAYKQLADKESKVIFGGRLGEYKYYDMEQVIAAALERCRLEF